MKIHTGAELKVEIIDLAFGGKGIAKIMMNDLPFTVFVDGGLPQQQLRVRISKKKRRYAEAKIIKVLKPSPLELTTEFQPTPGAPWLTLPLTEQQAHKQKQVFALFQKFADLDVTAVFDAYLSSPETHFYRNKMDYSFGPTNETGTVVPGSRGEGDTYTQWTHSGFGFGSKKRGQFWLVEDLTKLSGLFDADFEAFLPDFKAWCQAQNNSVYNAKTNTGFWRQLVVKKSFHENKFLLNVITNMAEDSLEAADFKTELTEFWQQALGVKLKGLYWTQSSDTGNANDKYEQRDLIYGEPTVTEQMCDLKFSISIDSFFQTNIFSAEKLYLKTANYVSNASHILELFAGTGTISQILARKYPQAAITSVEIVPAAVEDAKHNASHNQLTGINFVCDDVNKFMKRFEGQPPAVVLDPPRAGISPKALQKIIDFAPQEIVYVSCNAATLARDTQTLVANGYTLKKLSLIDQFPHTAHVECLARFVNTL